MAAQDSTLLKLHEAYERLFDKFDDVIEFRRDVADAKVPTELDVLFFMPQGGPNDDDITTVATAGMSSRAMDGPYERVELALEVKGRVEEDGRKKMAKQLAELATVPFRQEEPIAPNTVIEGLRLYPFDKMTHALIVHWQVLAEVFLPGTVPTASLLRLVPLYESEAKLVGEISAIQAYTRLQAKGVIFEDFEREPSM